MALPTIPARFIPLDLPRSPEDGPRAVQERLLASARKRSLDAHKTQMPGPIRSDAEEVLEGFIDKALSEEGALSDVFTRARRRTLRYLEAREKKMAALAHLKSQERELVIRAAHGTSARGVLTPDLVDLKSHEIHARFPWMARASTVVMNHLRNHLRKGPAPAHLPPLILHGPPGIAKSSWARAMAEAYDLPAIEIDVGATNGATFAIAGLERGWGSAMPGRVVTTMLQERVANPLVILDEIDKIPTSVATSRGGMLPGAFEVLKSMIEPTTARNWICPFYQIPFDLTAVSWVMTTNSIDQIPAPFLDRCRVVRVEGPDYEQMRDLIPPMVAKHTTPETEEVVLAMTNRKLKDAHRAHETFSLRRLSRFIEEVAALADKPFLN